MTSTATADMPLRQGWLRLKGSQPGGLVAHPLDILLQVPRVLAAPHARLAWHLRGFVTNSRE